MQSSTSTISRSGMGVGAKAALVVGGYAFAFAVGLAAVALEVRRTNALTPPPSDGMAAFSESLLFMAAFGAVALFPTAGALYFLRPVARFWWLASGLALVIAASGLGAGGVFVFGNPSDGWTALAFIRLMMAPFFVAGFALSAAFAPEGRWRRRLWVAVGIEGLGFACALAKWLLSIR